MSSSSSDEMPVEEALRELDAELLALIRRGLERRTTSISSFGAIITGNAYQSVNLRGEIATGFRRSDPELFAGIPLQGKRFIDLGCNYGEKTRLAALAGAEYAEGVEYEEYFVRIGGLLSTYNRAFNVVVRQGDITQPGCVRADFDVGACFSAFVYLRQNLDEVLSRIRKLFILETHAMEAGWFEQYIPPVAASLPHWILYGFSDHGRGLETQRRAQIAFAREKEDAGLVAINRAAALSLTHSDVRSLSLPNSRRAQTLMGNRGRSRLLFGELRNSIATLGSHDQSELRELLRSALPQLDEIRIAYGQTKTHFGTDYYWRVLFDGIVHYLENLGLTPANPYLIFMRELVSQGAYDAGMTYELATEERAIARLAPRLERIVSILLTKAIPSPLVIFNPLAVPGLTREGYTPQDSQLDEHIHIEGRGEYRIQYIDGNHRLAAMWLSGASSCPVLPVWTNIFGLDKTSFAVFADSDKQDRLLVPLLAKSVLQL
ncbi:class I SAM-dependent methyltransferase [Dankookia rubra]|uniref:Class I SAM-dependent methyltransferase n=1 Tax=Dankookia rubra TaxID=1442381 RepID=A0A4R5QAC3_9PROT|nr:class I SAM-dependent methyltransferase [Dankookia rubra]TDH60002.1 class I SAM-dependent methyltransferase [Dankookia rubra]